MNVNKYSTRLFYFLISLFCLVFCNDSTYAQTVVSFNVLTDMELSKAGEKSHYYYNGIDQENTNWRIGVSQLNLMGGIAFNSNWSFNSRFLLERDKGQGFKKFSIPQLNVKWISNKRKLGFTVGLFNNPFGSFNQKQLSTKRKFVGLPLAYSYFTNISSKIGFLPGMGDITKIAIDGDTQWGSSNLYYGGYASGAMLSWNIKPTKASLKFAIVSGAALDQNPSFSINNIGLSTRLKLQPTYYWEHGFSISHGTFMESSEASMQLEKLSNYTQTIFGTDFKLGKGYFEISGELIGTRYKVPYFNGETMIFNSETIDQPLQLSSFSGYLDLKYEVPFFVGSYISFRTDHLRFGKTNNTSNEKWDNNVLRHSMAFGYDLNEFLLLRMSFSIQDVENKDIWNNKQNVFQLVLTAHY